MSRQGALAQVRRELGGRKLTVGYLQRRLAGRNPPLRRVQAATTPEGFLLIVLDHGDVIGYLSDNGQAVAVRGLGEDALYLAAGAPLGLRGAVVALCRRCAHVQEMSDMVVEGAIESGRMPNPRRRNPTLAVVNPPSGPVDEDAARELELYITSDADLYRQQYQPIIANLMRKRRKGVYDSARAVTLFMYLVDNGAKKYLREFSTGERIDTVFNRATRLVVAAALRDSFEAEAALGNYDNMWRNPAAGRFQETYHKGDRVVLRPDRADAYGEPRDRVFTVAATKPDGHYKKTWVWLVELLDPNDPDAGAVTSHELRPYLGPRRNPPITYADAIRLAVQHGTVDAAAVDALAHDFKVSRAEVKADLVAATRRRNPPVGGTLADQVLRMDYVHHEDGKEYTHDFSEDAHTVEATVDDDGRRVTLRSPEGERIVEDF